MNLLTPCVVFDIDDTLYLERDYVRSGFSAVDEYVEKHFGVSGFFDVAWALFKSGKRGRIFDEALATMKLESGSATVAALVEVYRTHKPAIALEEDALKLIEHLVGKGHQLAAITDGPIESQHAKIHALGIRDWMTPIVVTAELGAGRGKPHAAAFELIERQTRKSGAQCCYVADNPMKDFIAPRALGWSAVRIRRPDGIHASVECQCDVSATVKSLADLIE